MTADTFSSTLGYLVMGTGNDNNSWGANANAEVFQVFEDAIANALTSTVTGGTLDLSGLPPPAAASQVRYAALIFNGTLLSAGTVKVPNLSKFWWVQNQTNGAFALTIQTPSGSASTAIPQNSGWQLVQCDGSNNITVSPFNYKQIQMPDGSAAAPPFSNINETNSGWYRFGTQEWRFSINATDVIQLTGAGASSPNLFNVLSPLVLQQGGVNIPAIAAAGSLTGMGAITGGASYTNGTYNAVALTGGAGTGATANITVSGGAVTAVTLVQGGKNFVVGNTLSAAAASIGGTGSGFAIPVTAVSAAVTPGDFVVFAGTAGIGDGGTPGRFATVNTITAALLAPGAAPLPYVAAQTNDNLHLLNDGSNATRDINVTVGRVRDDSDATNLQLAATMFKRLDTGWAAGGGPTDTSAAGACDSGTKGASQTWHTFLIGKLAQSVGSYARSGTTVTITLNSHGFGQGGTARIVGINSASVSGIDGTFPITGVTTNTFTYTSTVSGTIGTTTAPAGATADGFDVLCSQSYASPTMPSGWTVKQCLGSVLTDGSSSIRAFTQLGDEIWYASPVLDVNAVSVASGSATTLTLGSTPNGVSVTALINTTFNNGSGNSGIYIKASADADLAPTSTLTPLEQTLNAVAGVPAATQIRVRTNTSQQITARLTASTFVNIATLGYRDPRRRLF